LLKLNFHRILFFLTVSVFLTAPLFALQVTPDFFSFQGPVNTKRKIPVRVFNDGDRPTKVVLEVHGAEDGSPWLSVSPRKMSLRPGQVRFGSVRVRVPMGAGEKNGELWVRAQGPVSDSELRSVRRVRLTIEGTDLCRLLLESPQKQKEKGLESLLVSFVNEGNVTIKPHVSAEFSLADGTKKNVHEKNVFPLAPGERGNVTFPTPSLPWTKGWVTAYFVDRRGTTQKEVLKIQP